MQPQPITADERQPSIDASLGYLPHGLSLFDRQDQLLLANRQFQRMYDLPDDAVRPGVTLQAILDAIGDQDLRNFFVAFVAARHQTSETNQVLRTSDGRALTISCETMPDGSYAVMHEQFKERANEPIPPCLATNDLDVLTGLMNRSAFNELLGSCVERSQETFEEVAFLYLDLDRFKPVNDTLGHSAGDELLKQVVSRIQQEIRSTDVFARLGGDEFAVLQANVPQPDGSRSLAARVIETVSAPYHINGHTVSVGVSIGVAVAPFDADNPSSLLKNADLAMYRAKEDGRNTVRFFEPEMEERLRVRRTMEAELQQAVDNQEFQLLYQPVMDFESSRIVAVEALLRWQHPKRGRVSPADFIPIAESTGLIVPIGEWVLREACRDALNWADHVRVAVNVSAIQLRDRAFVDTVVNCLGEADLPADRLELEITETALLSDTELTIAILTELREIGVKIAMDDFGTGYSSISYLRRFPFDKIKIDRSFVSGADEDSEASALIRMIASLGISLAVTTTAEGVETESEMDVVREAGCSQIQGYLLSEPVPSAELPYLLQQMPKNVS